MEITIEPTYKQHHAWEILHDDVTAEFLFGGGAGGGKSWIGCEWLISMCIQFPGTRYFIARKRLKILKQTTLITFFKVCKHHGLKRDVHYRYREQQSVIEFIKEGSTIDLLEVDFKPSDPDYEDLGSSEYTSGWIEEGGEIHFGAFDTLNVRVGRHMNDKYGIFGKIFITCNPKKNWLYKYFYKPWKDKILPENRRFLQSLVDDNPRNEKGYKEKLLNLKNKNKKERLLRGNWEYDDDPAVLINFEAIADLFTNTIDESEDKYITLDVARFGDDLIVLKCWKGMKVYKVKIRHKQGIDVTASWLRETAKNEKVPYSHIVVDEDGVGGGVVDLVQGVRGFVANSSSLEDMRYPNEYYEKEKLEKPNYRSLKAQCAYMLADEINNHRMTVQPDIIECDDDIDYEELLTEDLEQIRAKDVDNEGKLDIVEKKDVKENIGRSPDFGDNLIMRMIFFLRLPQVKNSTMSVHKPTFRGYNRR